MNPFFSIIIPAFNLEKYIKRAISSVLNQEFQDFEIIIINDGSTDNTSKIINEFKSYNNITVITHLLNESLHISRMDGVLAANGQYILFLDGDDYFAQNAFNILNDSIKNNQDFDFYEFGYIKQPSGSKVYPSFSGENRFLSYFNNEGFPSHTIWNKVYKTNLLKISFSMMERCYINNVEDLYESIVISYYLNKTLNIKYIITNYSIGTGISTTYKNYKETIEHLQSVKTIFNYIKIFLTKIKQDQNLEAIDYRFMKFIIENYIIPQKNENDMYNLIMKLPDFFDQNSILKYFHFQIENNFKIINTIEFKLFCKIIKPLRWFKSFLKKNKITDAD